MKNLSISENFLNENCQQNVNDDKLLGKNRNQRYMYTTGKASVGNFVVSDDFDFPELQKKLKV